MSGHRADLIGLAGNEASPIHRLDPRTKLVGLLGLTVLAVSTPLAAWPVYIGCAAALVAVATVARASPRTIWTRARFVLPLVLFVALFLPFAREGGTTWSFGPVSVSGAGLAVLAAVAVKATLGTVSAVLLGATTTFPDVLRALEALRVPRVFTLIAAFMYRYLFVIVDEVRRMRAALASRGYRPRHALAAGPLGRVVAALLLRSYARGERVYLAMVARGYGGAVPQLDRLAFRWADAAFLGALALLVPLRVALGVAP